MPAVTIVAAWISADTGVGPAIASGSHVYSGNCADLPQQPTNSASAIEVTRSVGSSVAAWADAIAFTCAMFSVPNCLNTSTIATRKPRSPMRLTTKAF
jgi:hypothetical protein